MAIISVILLTVAVQALNVAADQKVSGFIPFLETLKPRNPVNFLVTKREQPTIFDVEPGWYELYPGVVATIRSPNYGQGVYPSSAKINWRFYGRDECQIQIECPCFRVEDSLGCRNDYLLVSGKWDFSQRYCGNGRDVAYDRVDIKSDFLSLHFSTNTRGRDSGFVCNIMCDSPAIPEIPAPCSAPDNVNGTQQKIAGPGSESEPTVLPPRPPAFGGN